MEKTIDIAQMKWDTYYHVTHEKDLALWVIVRCEGYREDDKSRINGPCISNMNGRLEYDGNGVWLPGRPIRYATQEEIGWLYACIYADKLVPNPNAESHIINNYEIY